MKRKMTQPGDRQDFEKEVNYTVCVEKGIYIEETEKENLKKQEWEKAGARKRWEYSLRHVYIGSTQIHFGCNIVANDELRVNCGYTVLRRNIHVSWHLSF